MHNSLIFKYLSSTQFNGCRPQKACNVVMTPKRCPMALTRCYYFCTRARIIPLAASRTAMIAGMSSGPAGRTVSIYGYFTLRVNTKL